MSDLDHALIALTPGFEHCVCGHAEPDLRLHLYRMVAMEMNVKLNKVDLVRRGELAPRVAELNRLRMTDGQIARTLGCSQTHVSKIAREMRLPIWIYQHRVGKQTQREERVVAA